MIVLADDLFYGPAATEQVDDKLHGNPRSLDNRLADKDSRINRDSVLPVHDSALQDSTRIQRSSAGRTKITRRRPARPDWSIRAPLSQRPTSLALSSRLQGER